MSLKKITRNAEVFSTMEHIAENVDPLHAKTIVIFRVSRVIITCYMAYIFHMGRGGGLSNNLQGPNAVVCN